MQGTLGALRSNPGSSPGRNPGSSPGSSYGKQQLRTCCFAHDVFGSDVAIAVPGPNASRVWFKRRRAVAWAPSSQAPSCCSSAMAITRPPIASTPCGHERTLHEHQWPSVAISGHQWPSVAISGHQRSSVAISEPSVSHPRVLVGNQRAIGRNQVQSGAIGRNERRAPVGAQMRDAIRCNQGPSDAMRGEPQ